MVCRHEIHTSNTKLQQINGNKKKFIRFILLAMASHFKAMCFFVFSSRSSRSFSWNHSKKRQKQREFKEAVRVKQSILWQFAIGNWILHLMTKPKFFIIISIKSNIWIEAPMYTYIQGIPYVWDIFLKRFCGILFGSRHFLSQHFYCGKIPGFR